MRLHALRVSASILALAISAQVSSAGQPSMTVTPLVLEFPVLEVGTTSEPLYVEIANAPGGSSLSFWTSLIGADAGNFALSCETGTTSCLSGWLDPGHSSFVQVTYRPASPGTHQVILQVTGSDTQNPYDEVLLTGWAFERIFTDGFENGELQQWSSCVGCLFWPRRVGHRARPDDRAGRGGSRGETSRRRETDLVAGRTRDDGARR